MIVFGLDELERIGKQAPQVRVPIKQDWFLTYSVMYASQELPPFLSDE